MLAARPVTIIASLPHGHVAAVHAMAVKLGRPRCSARLARSGTWRWRWYLSGNRSGIEAVHPHLVG